MNGGRLVAALASALVLAPDAPASAAPAVAAPGPATLVRAERATLERFLSAIVAERYDRAFALLTAGDQRYFASADNFASVYRADRVYIDSFRMLGETRDAWRGAVAVVAETVRFYDHAHQAVARGSVTVRYGIVGAGQPRIKDPYHPWRAIAPVSASTERDGLRVTIRKISFFSGRVELLATFANVGNRATTILPYGRSVLRDETERAYTPIATRLASLTDRVLFTGLRLPPSGQYTGFLTFATPTRFRPKRLAVAIGPALQDGTDAPMVLHISDVLVAK